MYEKFEKKFKEIIDLQEVEKINLNDAKKLASFGGFADDMRNYILGNVKALQTLSKSVLEAKEQAQELEKNIKQAKQLDKDINKIKQSVTKAAKELGVNPNDIKAYSDTDEKQARLRGELDQAERTIAGVSSVIKF